MNATAIQSSPARRPTAIHEQQVGTGRTTITEATGTRAARGSARSAESGGGTYSPKRHRTSAEKRALLERIAEVSTTVTDIEAQAAAVGLTVPVLYVYRNKAKAAGFTVAKVKPRRAGTSTDENGGGGPRRARCAWTEAEDRRLQNIWGEKTIRGIRQSLGRSNKAIVLRARLLGLPIGVQPGMESVNAAAARTGYDQVTLRKILAWAGVEPVETWGMKLKNHNSYRLHAVDSQDVDDAIARFLKHESIAGAARRRNVEVMKLQRWLINCGDEWLPPRPEKNKRWLVPTDLIDDVIAKQTRLESVSHAAHRLGVHYDRLAALLKAAGVERGTKRFWMLDPEVIDRAFAGGQPALEAAA